MVLTIVSKIIGFGREITLSYFYGASYISDVFLISQTIPTTIFTLIGNGISTGYIPMYSNIEKKHGIQEANKFTNNLTNILMLICTLLVILSIIFAKPLVKLFASGFQGETLDLAITFTRITLFGIYFTAVISIYKRYLQIKGNYAIPALVAFPMNFLLILSMGISSKTNIMVLAIGSVITTASQLLLLIPFLNKTGYQYKPLITMKDPYIKNMIYLALPVTIGMSVNQINVLVDRTLASNIAVGGISALNYANRLNQFVQGIFVVSIITVMYPIISKMAAENNIKGLRKSMSEAILSISLLVVPATIGAMIFAGPIITLLFGRGAFGREAISMTSSALFFYSIGMIGFGIRDILSRGFYAMQDTKTPMINATIAMVFNIILNLILSRYIGIGGLALATSIAGILCAILLYVSFRKKVGSIGIKYIALSFIKIVFASLVMGIIAKIIYNILFQLINGNISLMIAIGIGAFIYFSMIYFMKIKEVDIVVNAVKSKFTKKR